MKILHLRLALLLFYSLTTRYAKAVIRDGDDEWERTEGDYEDEDAIFIGVDSKRKLSSSHLTSTQKINLDTICATKGKLSCSTHCDHAKFYYSDGCCRCECRKNFLLIDFSICREASWAKWSGWSRCIETEWGGVQTRERVCRSEKENAPGSCSGRGSRSRNCSPVTSAFRIRKNIRELTDDETHDLIQAMTRFKKNKTANGYRNIVSWHGYPGRCPWYHDISGHNDNHCSFHHHPLFLPWHRLITTQLEIGLQKYLKNKTMGIPFWDWTQHAKDVPYIIRHPEIYDPILKKFVVNPFYRTLISDGKHKIYSHRFPWYPGILDDNLLRKGTIRALFSHNYAKFDARLENNPHDQIHNCFCYSKKLAYDGSVWCDYGLPTVTYAAWDPAFLLHHSAIDRIFTMRRKLEESAGVADWTKSRVVSQFEKMRYSNDRTIYKAFDWPLSPFCNKSMNNEITTLRNKVWTLHKSYYGESLFGFKYTNYNLGDYLWKDLQKDYKRNNVDRKYWNDDFFLTKSGDLTRNFCKNYSFDKHSQCQMSC